MHEIQRQAAVLAAGGTITQETRHWHEDTRTTTAGRPKSDADDYRYFPEPDLLPVVVDEAWIERVRAELPELPAVRNKRLKGEWGFSDAEFRDVVNAGVADQIAETVGAGATPAAARKWWMGEVSRRANDQVRDLADMGVTPEHVAELDGMVRDGRLNDSMARQVMDGVLAGEGSPREVADARGLELVQDDSALEAAFDEVLGRNADIVAKIKDGKVQAAGALIGQVMKAMKGQADAGKVRELIMAKCQ